MAEPIKDMIDSSLPEVDFLVSARGIQITSERLLTPRFVPFDTPGKCHLCKCDGVEIDFAVSQGGITFFCPRMKGLKFVAFDLKKELPNHCVFRVKTKGRVFNIPHTINEEDSSSINDTESSAVEELVKAKHSEIDKLLQNIASEINKQPEEEKKEGSGNQEANNNFIF